jgi:hypothetical protein
MALQVLQDRGLLGPADLELQDVRVEGLVLQVCASSVWSSSMLLGGSLPPYRMAGTFSGMTQAAGSHLSPRLAEAQP